MLHSQSSRVGSILLLLTAIIAFAVALYAWWTPLTGVTGTIGALGVVIASVVLAILTFMLRAASRGARFSDYCHPGGVGGYCFRRRAAAPVHHNGSHGGRPDWSDYAEQPFRSLQPSRQKLRSRPCTTISIIPS